jgi:hypothetical protein
MWACYDWVAVVVFRLLTQEDRLLAAKLVNVYFSFFKVMCFTYDLKSVNMNADHEEDTLDNIYERRGMTLVSVLFV